jgi:uncharacterized protein (TIGR02099 family)
LKKRHASNEEQAPARAAKPKRSAFGRWRRFFVRLMALGVVACALVIALAKLALPWIAAHPEILCEQLSNGLKTPVLIGAVQSDWQARPRLSVQDLQLGSGDRALRVAAAQIELDPFGFLPGRRWVRDLTILGAQLTLEQTPLGWRLQGLGQTTAVSAAQFDRLTLLNAIGRLSIRNTQLVVRPALGASFRIDNANLALRRKRDELRAALVFEPPSAIAGGNAPQGTLDLRLRYAQSSQTLALYGAVENNRLRDLAALVGAFGVQAGASGALVGDLSGKVWLDLTLERDTGNQTHGALSGGKIALSSRDSRAQTTGTLSLQSRNGSDWQGELALSEPHNGNVDLQPSAVAARLRLGEQKRLSLSIASAEAPIALGALSRFAGAHLPLEQARAIARLALAGRLESFALQAAQPVSGSASTAPHWNMRLRARGVSSASYEHIPGVKNADIDLAMDANALSIQVQGTGFVLHAPKSFRKPITIDALALNAALWPALEGWSAGFSAEADEVALHAPGYDATAYIGVEKSFASAAGAADTTDPAEEPASIAISLAVSRGDIAKAAEFWVIDKMPIKVIHWLDSALVRGQTGAARAVYRGPMKRFEFPFERAQGRFEASFALNDAQIRYSPDWPALLIADSDFTLLNDSFIAHRVQGSILGNPVRALSGDILDFKAPIARFHIDGAQRTQDLLTLLRQSPIGSEFGSHFSGLTAGGEATVALELVLPLRPDLGEKVVSGTASLSNAELINPDWRLSLNAVNGSLAFDRFGFEAKALQALQNGLPVRLTASVGAPHTRENGVIVAATLDGAMSPEALFGHEAVLAPILAKVSGSSAWKVGVKTVRTDAGQTLTTAELSSNLVGVAIDLPSPLGKPETSARSLRLSVPTEASSQRALVLEMDGGVRFTAELGDTNRAFRGALILGENASDRALPAQGLKFIGSMAELDLSAWAALVGSTASASGGMRLANLDIQAAKLIGPLAQFPGAVRLAANPNAQGWKISVDSTAAAGNLLWRTDLATPALTAQFKHLHLPDPGDGGALSTTIDPRIIPTLHVYVEELNVGSAKLGATRLESYPTAEGMKIDLLESKSGDLTLTGSGDWRSTALAGSESRFKLRFSAQDLGRMLGGLGFSGHVSGGQTLADMDVHWPGAPIEFALARLNGRLKVWVGPGRFLELDPGAGRLFGLLSVRELPRRLALDFRDFFQSGMSFSEVAGSFTFASGNAFTSDMRILAPAADITIHGRTGLSTRDYEQTALVSPKVGALPIVGALAGGPVGAAAGLLAQGVLEGEKTLTANYKISGTWEKPLVVKQATIRAARRSRTRPAPVQAPEVRAPDNSQRSLSPSDLGSAE